jgi:hypothetical protein
MTRLRFGLGTLLIAIAALSVVLGIITHRARLQREAVRVLQRAEADLLYDDGQWDSHTPSVWKSCVADWLGRDFVYDVKIVNLYDQRGPAVLNAVGSLSRLRQLSIPHSSLRAEDTLFLRNLPELTWLDLSYNADLGGACFANMVADRLQRLEMNATSVDDDDLPGLLRFRHLRVLSLDGTHVTDRGLMYLMDLPELKHLFLEGTAVSDEGCHTLARFPALQSVTLIKTQVTDEGLQALAESATLQRIEALHTAVTAAGIARFQRAKPGCDVNTVVVTP